MSERLSHRPKLPPWIRIKVGKGRAKDEVRSILEELHLNTVCGSAQCPNLEECWHRNTATFMILGDECTRNCRFCAVNHSPAPQPPDTQEPERIAEAVSRMHLKYVVITSVTRDDMPDGGASQFAAVICEIRKSDPEIEVEVLTPDYLGKELETVLSAGPSVFNHNIETVERLSASIRLKADYRRSLEVLKCAVEFSEDKIPVKSGLMVGMGERDEEVKEAICDIRKTGASILTIGQYLPPSGRHWPLERYVEPAVFDTWKEYALELGFESVASAPLVRSSYHAEEIRDVMTEKSPEADAG